MLYLIFLAITNLKSIDKMLFLSLFLCCFMLFLSFYNKTYIEKLLTCYIRCCIINLMIALFGGAFYEQTAGNRKDQAGKDSCYRQRDCRGQAYRTLPGTL